MRSSPSHVARAVTAILGAAAAAAVAQETDLSSNKLAEVIVTSQKRTQDLQDVPITVTAITAQNLQQLDIKNLDDLAHYLPSVQLNNNGPGQTNIYIRGIGCCGGGTLGYGAIGPFPPVAEYLDDQSMALPARNLDVYTVDLERVEVLEGPQGTLFGGGAEAGVVRYITNKPKLNVLEAVGEGSYGTTAGGDPNSSANFVLNLPLIADKLAVRGVAYTDRRGGYINNVASEFTRMGTDLGLRYRNGGQVPADSEVINNYNIAGRAINPVTYSGLRVSVLWKINDDWDALLTQSYQSMDAQGVFYQSPVGAQGQPLPPYSVTTFNPSRDQDKFENTALTVSGKLGPLKAVYSGAYLVRNVDQVQDYTQYARGYWGTYYQCNGYSTNFDPTTKCYSPSSTWDEHAKTTHQSHEFRVSTPEDKRLRALVGVYWEDFKLYDQTDYNYMTVPTCTATFNTQCFLPLQTYPGAQASNPGVRPPNDAFFDDVLRGYKQKAAYLSMDFDLIPHTLTLTAGTRYFQYDESETGSYTGAFYCKFYNGAVPNSFGPCSTTNYNGFGPGGAEGGPLNNHGKATGVRSRGNLTWRITPDAMVYYTFSEGYRPGGFNRFSGNDLVQNGVPQYISPIAWKPDNLKNNEVGFKTDWFDHRLTVNGTLYQEEWSDTQTVIADPEVLGNLNFFTNGGTYRVRGFEPQITALVMRGLTLSFSGNWNRSKQTKSPYLVNNNPASPGFGQIIASVPNPYGPPGTPLPYDPTFEGTLRLRYEWSFNDYNPYIQASGFHTNSSYSATGYAHGFNLPAYTTLDAAVGVAKDRWLVEAFGRNLTNNNAFVSEFQQNNVVGEAPLRPRVLGIRASYRFTE
jgi:iron complex outermembrane recepter protein